jgi:lysophospholipase L1-like esterase
VFLVLFTLVGLTAAASMASAAAPRSGIGVVRSAVAAGGLVVLLGDSYAAGNLVPVSPAGEPIGCLRSTHNFGADVARTLNAKTFTDVACSGATSASMTHPQVTFLGTNAAQFNNLAGNDALVMVTLGGDDFGGFSHVMETCMLLSFTSPWGAPCAKHYGNSLAAAIAADAPKIAADLNGIRTRAPGARVLEVGYPDIFPDAGNGCWPAVPIAAGDIAFLRGLEKDLNSMLASEAAATGVTYVDTYTPTIGHDFCQPADVRYVEGLIPGSIAEPFHPNAHGYRAIAAAVLKVLG